MVRRIEYSSDKDITQLQVDSTNDAIWVAFAKNTSNQVILERQSAFEPSQTFFNLTRSVDKIVAMAVNTTHLFIAYEDSTLLGEKLSLTNPLTDSSNTDF